MEDDFSPDTIVASDTAAIPLVEETSAEYLGRWHRLVSTTNWEKGRIIHAWRRALLDAGAPAGCYSDEAWSRRAGSVSAQHVGRLRRVYERFGRVQEQYGGLYWSHFQAAVDWPDAEMWLEGAVQNGWSVAAMRQQRWQALGAAAELKPRDEDIIQAEFDEDAGPAADAPLPETIGQSLGVVQAAGTNAEVATGPAGVPDSLDVSEVLAEAAVAEPFRPFADLGPLPPDLSEAFESFKLAILHHKLSGWQEVACDDVVAALQALQQLALAPGDTP